MACNNSHQILQYDWILDSATTSHICAIWDAFIDYTPLKDSSIKGLGDPVTAHRRGTVLVDFAVNGKTIRHQLWDVLHVPDAPNCLLSIPHIDEAQGHVEMKGGECILKDKEGIIIRKGNLSGRLYILEAKQRHNSLAKKRLIMQHPTNSPGINGTDCMDTSWSHLWNNLIGTKWLMEWPSITHHFHHNLAKHASKPNMLMHLS